MYLGYQLEINGLKLPIPDGEESSILQNGSYNFRKESRVLNEWTDANGTRHADVARSPKVSINFTIKEHSQEQQNKLSPLFRKRENIFLEYWDDYDSEYKTGDFYIESMEAVSSIATEDTVYYAPLSITLKEY